jgi:D-3-phosphoglycerate dehydrogenase / 2-oxoglutarate reductase
VPHRGKVLITDHTWPDVDLERGILDRAGLQVIDAPRSDEATLRALAEDSVAIMTCFAQVTSGIIASAPALEVIGRYGVGVDNIAIDAATARGIPVTYVPDYCVAEVAEHALALLMSLARGIVRYDGSIKARAWSLGVAAPLRRIEGQTLGLIGCGRIGRRLAEKAVGLRMRVLVYDSNPAAVDAAAASGLVGADLHQVLAEADFLSLHLPLTAGTRGFIGESVLRQMKSTAFLINTARGGLVDTDALARAVREGWIAGAALDVLPQEPPAADDPLMDLDNIVLTPHVAFYSEESLQALRQRTATSVVDALAGRAPEHVWNRDALGLASTR